MAGSPAAAGESVQARGAGWRSQCARAGRGRGAGARRGGRAGLTAWYDPAAGRANKALAQPTLKTIAAFANTDGGTLIIGRCDDGVLQGIDGDLSVMQDPDVDAFERHLRDLVATTLGIPANHLVSVSFPRLRRQQLAHVRVRRALEPIFMKDKGVSAFFIRTGNLTRQLDVAEAHTYIRRHWHG